MTDTPRLTGAQHAAKAEELLAAAEQLLDGPRCHHAREYAYTAQAHATLALRALVAQAIKGQIPAAVLTEALAAEPNPVSPSPSLLRRWLR